MKRHALLVGVNSLNYDYYGENKDLCSCYADTEELQDLLNRHAGFDLHEIDVRNTWETKWLDVLNDLNKIRKKAAETIEDFFILLYFSGHGASIKLEVDGELVEKQFLCFYDRLIIEDMILEQLQDFGSNCKITVILDACHSAFTDTKTRRLTGDPLIKSLSEEFKFIYQLHWETYDRMIKTYKRFHFEPQAEIFFLFACGKDETTESGGSCSELSYFTYHFCDKWTSFLRKMNCIEFTDKLDEYVKNKVSCDYFPKEGDAFFRNKYPLIF